MDNINTKQSSRKKREKETKNKNNLNYKLESYYIKKKKQQKKTMHQKFYRYNNPYNLCKKHVEKTPDAFC